MEPSPFVLSGRGESNSRYKTPSLAYYHYTTARFVYLLFDYSIKYHFTLHERIDTCPGCKMLRLSLIIVGYSMVAL